MKGLSYGFSIIRAVQVTQKKNRSDTYRDPFLWGLCFLIDRSRKNFSLSEGEEKPCECISWLGLRLIVLSFGSSEVEGSRNVVYDQPFAQLQYNQHCGKIGCGMHTGSSRMNVADNPGKLGLRWVLSSQVQKEHACIWADHQDSELFTSGLALSKPWAFWNAQKQIRLNYIWCSP